jgi:trichodiene synthase
MFDETKLFKEITTAICMMENWMVWVNDLISFYKEFDDPRDQTSLINNYAHVEIMTVFADKDPRLVNTLTRFMHGYVTWHLCDDRYRISEIYKQVDGGSEVDCKFRHYYEEANKVGRVEASEWAVPIATTIIEQERVNTSYLRWMLDRFQQGRIGEVNPMKLLGFSKA